MTAEKTDRFEIMSAEGLPIRGVLAIPQRPRCLVITIHGFKGFMDWSFFPWTSEQFVASRFAACRFNMSRSGIDRSVDTFDRLDLFADDTYSIQLSDLRSVVAHLQSIPEVAHLPVFLFGHSRGGAIALLGARETPGLAGIVTWASISHVGRYDEATIRQWRHTGRMEIVNQRTNQIMPVSTRILDDIEAHPERLHVLNAVRQLAVPLLVVHGKADESVPVEEGEQIAAAAKDASLVLIAKASHTFGAIHPLIHVPKELKIAMSVSTRFIESYS